MQTVKRFCIKCEYILKEKKCPKCNQSTFFINKNDRFPANPRIEDYRFIAGSLDAYSGFYDVEDLPRVETFIRKYRKTPSTDFTKLKESKLQKQKDSDRAKKLISVDFSLEQFSDSTRWLKNTYEIPKYIRDFIKDKGMSEDDGTLVPQTITFYSNISLLYSGGVFGHIPEDLFKIYQYKVCTKGGTMFLTNGMYHEPTFGRKQYKNIFFKTAEDASIFNHLIAEEFMKKRFDLIEKFPSLKEENKKYIKKCSEFLKKYHGPELYDLYPEYYL